MTKMKTKNKFRFIGIGTAVLSVLVLSFAILKTSIQSNLCANSISCIKNLTGEFDPTVKNAEFLGQNLQAPSFIAEKPDVKNVLEKSLRRQKELKSI